MFILMLYLGLCNHEQQRLCSQGVCISVSESTVQNYCCVFQISICFFLCFCLFVLPEISLQLHLISALFSLVICQKKKNQASSRQYCLCCVVYGWIKCLCRLLIMKRKTFTYFHILMNSNIGFYHCLSLCFWAQPSHESTGMLLCCQQHLFAQCFGQSFAKYPHISKISVTLSFRMFQNVLSSVMTDVY